MTSIAVVTTHEDETTAAIHHSWLGGEGAHTQPIVTAEMMGSNSLRGDVLREITQLSDTVFQIEQHLTIIARSIHQLDTEEVLKDTDGHPLEFYSQWNSYREIYSSLLTNSHSTARQLRRKIDDLMKTLIPLINDSGASFDNKKEWVIEFIKGLDGFKTRGIDTAQGFYDLRERIRNFERNLRNELETQNIVVEQKIKEILENVKQLEAEIEASSGFFSACRSVLDMRTVLSSAKRAPITTMLLCVSGVGALRAGYTIIQGLDRRAQEMQGKRDSILNLQLEQILLNSRQDELEKISPKITQLTSTFDEIVNRLGATQQIWKMISSDVIGLQEAMGQLKNARTSAGFDRRISDVEKLWRALACALEGYACGVGPCCWTCWGNTLKQYWPLILVVLWDLWHLYFEVTVVEL